MIFINASGFHRSLAQDHSDVYYATPEDYVAIESIQEALKPAHWKDRFHPFAQILVNTLTREIVLVRDHLGVRPLYYWYQSDQLIFGDTIPDILKYLRRVPPFLESEIANLFSSKNYYSDDTLYQGIYRVEPGHMIYINSNGISNKHCFWRLESEGPPLLYSNRNDYLDQFSALLDESIAQSIKGSHNIAAEFSAGMDSTTVYCASRRHGLNPTLFMHSATPDSQSATHYNDWYEKEIIEHFSLNNIQRIDASDFDPILIFKNYSKWFAGSSPYIFEVFANPLHRAVSREGFTLLLSGFGGDQGVSHPLPTRFILPELINQRAYKLAWHELRNDVRIQHSTSPMNSLRCLLRFIQYAHPFTYKLIQATLETKVPHKTRSKHPYHCSYFKTLREAEWAFLQGPFSHEIRMRIEYSSIVSKKMGFEYRYPLLYPKLLEFFLAIPISEKRHHGVGRYLMRRYLAKQLPKPLFDAYNKREGLSILPATMDYFKPHYLNGVYANQFQELPFSEHFENKNIYKNMIQNIQALMIKTFCESIATHEIAEAHNLC